MSKLKGLIGSSPIILKNFIIDKFSNIHDKTNLNLSAKIKSQTSELASNIIEKTKQLSTPTHDFKNIGDVGRVSIIFHCGENLTVGLPMVLDWIELTESIKENCVFVVRSTELFEALLNKKLKRNIVFATSPIDIENLCAELPNLENVCFLSNTANNIHFIRFNIYKHIFVGNFDIERQPNVHKYFRVYDDVWVHSESKKNLFLDSIEVNHLKIYNTGNPLRKIESESVDQSLKIKKIYLKFNTKVNINKSFLAFFFNFYEMNKEKKFEYIVEDDKSKSINHLKQIAKEMKYNIKFSNNINYSDKYDAIICDYESDRILNKFFSFNLPIYYYSPNVDHDYFSDVVGKINTSKYVQYCISFSSLDDLNELINKNSHFFKTEDFKKFLEYEFGISEGSQNKFDSFVKSLLPNSINSL